MVPSNRRPEKAVIMADLKRLGVEFNPAAKGSDLHELLLEHSADPLDHDADGTKGGSKPGAESTAAKGAARRKAMRRGNRK